MHPDFLLLYDCLDVTHRCHGHVLNLDGNRSLGASNWKPGRGRGSCDEGRVGGGGGREAEYVWGGGGGRIGRLGLRLCWLQYQALHILNKILPSFISKDKK